MSATKFEKPDLRQELFEAVRSLRDLKKSRKEMTAALNEEIKEAEDLVRQLTRAIEDGESQLHLADAGQ